MSEDETNNSLEILISWAFHKDDRVWRFICFLALEIETEDANLWLSDIINQNYPELSERET